MSKAVITFKKPVNTVRIKNVRRIRSAIRFSRNGTVTIDNTLPFRVKFMAVGIPGEFSPTNPPPIPLQIIGFSNYIL